MRHMPVVAGFNLTPVKSTALQHPHEVDLRAEGTAGDRRFLFARATGERLSGISKASLMPIRSSWDAASERLTLALGDEVVESEALGHGDAIAVRLFDREVPARGVHADFNAFVRDLTGDETLSLLRVDEPEYGGGMHRVSIVSRASVADVGVRAGDAALDPRRFRMLIEVEGVGAYEEDAWQNRRVQIGDTIIRCGERMPRCVMTTLDPDTGAQDAPVLDALAQNRRVGSKLLLGVYGDVERPGRLKIGDTIKTLD
jgi:uncharacterized protein YcbX